MADDVSRLKVTVRLSAPWRGTSGRLQVALETPENNDHLNPWVIDEMRSKFVGEGIGVNRLLIIAMPKLEPRWIYAGEVDLTAPDWQEIAVSGIESLVSSAADLALEINEECEFSKKMIGLLEECRKKLEEKPISTNWRMSLKKCGFWMGLFYVQIDRASKPPFWVGFNCRSRNLMYGHNRLKEVESFPQVFAQAAGVSPEIHGGQPAGTLLNREELAAVLQDSEKQTVLIEKMYAYFLLYAETLSSLDNEGI